MRAKDGGPAFPRPFSDNGGRRTDTSGAQDGMTLRDWFAGRVLATYAQCYHNREQCADAAYRLADAMIAERDK